VIRSSQGFGVVRGGAAVDPADPWRYHVGVHGLTAGAYTVTWRVLSADDGHITHGAHVFAVGTGFVPSLAPPAAAEGPGLRPLARWLVAVGGALLVGVPLAVFWLGPMYRVFGTVNGAPFDVTFTCSPAGHVTMEDKSVVKVSNDVTRKGLRGSFGCPVSRSEAEFPPTR
jgi:hypothetical protein